MWCKIYFVSTNYTMECKNQLKSCSDTNVTVDCNKVLPTMCMEAKNENEKLTLRIRDFIWGEVHTYVDTLNSFLVVKKITQHTQAVNGQLWQPITTSIKPLDLSITLRYPGSDAFV